MSQLDTDLINTDTTDATDATTLICLGRWP
jgi:hypothetical protein